MSSLINSPAWKALEAHRREMSEVHMRDLFEEDPKRIAGTVHGPHDDEARHRDNVSVK